MNVERLGVFESRYNTVFDSDGNIKACGRKACIALMEACHELTGRPTTDFGNPDYFDGRMNVEAIKAVYQEIHK